MASISNVRRDGVEPPTSWLLPGTLPLSYKRHRAVNPDDSALPDSHRLTSATACKGKDSNPQSPTSGKADALPIKLPKQAMTSSS